MADGTDETPPDARRRALLRRIGFAGSAAWLAPGLSMLGVARADDDDDGGDDDGGGPAGRNGGYADPPPSAPRATPRSRAPAPQRQPARVPRPIAPPPEIVVLVPFVAPADTAGIVTAAGYRVIQSAPAFVSGDLLLRLGLPPGRSPTQARDEIGTLLPGSFVDENHAYRPDSFACGPEGCAAHAMVGWQGWPSAMSPRIGMIDTGINTDHSALAGQRLTTYQIDLPDRDASGRQHGTAVAAMLVGRTDGRVPGLLPLAELIAVEAFHNRGGTDIADAFSLARAMEVLIGERVQVINLSFSGPENAVLRRLVETAAMAGIGMVAAAGNGGPGAPPAYPAAWPEVVAVTAVDTNGRAYRQANRGPYVALAAPGVNLWTAASISGGRARSGTSYAAPFVTAALAVERLRMPSVPIAEVVARLIGCARDLGEAGFDETFGHGLLTSPALCTSQGEPYLTSGE
ncbi:MAG: S8 family serine peptidase [Gemmobacter sp.]